MKNISAIKGFNDILSEESRSWQFIEDSCRKVFHSFGFSEIRIPIVEKTELFSRSIGDVTDIVEKEMYTFCDKAGSSLTLRPEGTAGVMRALIEHKLYAINSCNKMYYSGPMFRHERPQKGRYRQFHQIGAEFVGVADPMSDAILLIIINRIFELLELNEPKLHLNSLGCRECRPLYRKKLISFLADKSNSLCADCTRRLDTNPLRVLDCKVPTCIEATQQAPSVLDNLCSDCSEHFQNLQNYLKAADIEFSINSRMVRGLDYYTRTTFEVVTGMLGSQSAVAAGGRYDGLVQQLGGPELPGIGFAMGVERVALLLADKSITQRPDLFIAMSGDETRATAIMLMSGLQRMGINVDIDTEGKSLKSQMRKADKLKARYSIVLGTNELQTGIVNAKRMDDGKEYPVMITPEAIALLLEQQ